MIDYLSLRALASVVETGSFERAARQLKVTPSAVSQRIKQLEERLGAALVVRGQPCTATEQGDRLCRHMERIGMLENELFDQLPALAGADERQPVTLQIAVNADSLGSWFLPAIAAFTAKHRHLVSVSVDDEDDTAEWLEKGKVVAAISSLATPVRGCRRVALGKLRYRAAASPAFMQRHFPDGVTEAALERAPALIFNHKDRLQERWMEAVLGRGVVHPSHWLPSTQSFVDGALLGIGWGMNPAMLVEEHIATGRLVELVADQPVDVPLYWQVNRLSADALAPLTRAVAAAARATLLPLPADAGVT